MVPILAVTLSPMFVFTCVSTLVAAMGVGYWFYKKDDEIEGRRKEADELSDVLKDNGFTLTAKVLDAYSRGDYDGILDESVALVRIMKNPITRKTHMQELCLKLAENQAKEDPAFGDVLMEKAKFFELWREGQRQLETAQKELKDKLKIDEAQKLIQAATPAKAAK